MAHGYEELLTESNQEVKRTKIVQSEPDPAVVFFPTNQDSECMDATTGGENNPFFDNLQLYCFVGRIFTTMDF